MGSYHDKQKRGRVGTIEFMDDHRLRMPPDLFDWLAARAARNTRSPTGELKAILTALREQDDDTNNEAPAAQTRASNHQPIGDT